MRRAVRLRSGYLTRQRQKKLVEIQMRLGKQVAPWLQTQFRTRHRVQASLALFGQAREDHRNMIAGVLVAGAGNHHAGTLKPVVVAWRLQRHGHFRPGIERRGAAKFDAASVYHNGIGRQVQAGLPGFNRDILPPGAAGFNFSRAHKLKSN